LDIPSFVGRDVKARKQCIVSRINGNMIGFVWLVGHRIDGYKKLAHMVRFY
jgi:hypothetical protein